jgi:hypothetical protein
VSVLASEFDATVFGVERNHSDDPLVASFVLHGPKPDTKIHVNTVRSVLAALGLWSQ